MVIGWGSAFPGAGAVAIAAAFGGSVSQASQMVRAPLLANVQTEHSHSAEDACAAAAGAAAGDGCVCFGGDADAATWATAFAAGAETSGCGASVASSGKDWAVQRCASEASCTWPYTEGWNIEKSHICLSKFAAPNVVRTRSNAPTSSKNTHLASGCCLLKSLHKASQRSCNAEIWTSRANRGSSSGLTPRSASLPCLMRFVSRGQTMFQMGISGKAGTPETKKFRAPPRYMVSRKALSFSDSRTPGLARKTSGTPPPKTPSTIFWIKSFPPVWMTTSVSLASNPPAAFGTCGLRRERVPWPCRSPHKEPGSAKLKTLARSLWEASTSPQQGCMYLAQESPKISTFQDDAMDAARRARDENTTLHKQ
mmetsp:Transcript_113055/g.359220  ORF Transcript_113055/g.359220 Transcript_113055/m.359220 type:complete len:367 (-) Transcript_113055:30-1130(-)